MKTKKEYDYTLVNTDVCLPGYFSGDSRPWLCLPVYPMQLDELKQQLISELSQGALGGNLDWQEKESDEFFNAAKKAISELSLADNLPHDHILFADHAINENNENDFIDSVCAYFVFIEN